MRRGRRVSWLDAIVYRFQHRWETNPQYRATISGVVGLLVLLTICACMGLVTTTTQLALAGLGVGTTHAAAGSGDVDTGVQAVGGTKKFPIPTVQVPSSVNLPPASPIPSSQTPVPGPTPTPTPPAAPTTTSGGRQFACSGSNWSVNPCPVSAGQQVTITFRFGGKHPNEAVTGEVSLCAQGCTTLFQPPNTLTTDSNGVASITLTVPSQAANSSVPITANAMLVSTGATIVLLAPPVQ